MWGETYAVDYILKASSDGKSWRTILAVTKGKGGTEEHTVDSTMARYLRIEGKKGAKGISAYSVREIEVFGE
jgi:hexosaminidase